MSISPGPMTHAGRHHELEVLPDEDLERLAREGDHAAVAQLLERHRRALLRYARAALGDQDADDVLQETLMRAYDAMPRRERTGAVRSWLFAIARNTCSDARRRRNSMLALRAPLSEETPSTTLIVEEQVAWRIAADQILTDLGRLPSRQRQVLILRALDERPYAQIATELGITEKGAQQAAVDARSTLKQAAAGRETDCGDIRSMLSGGDLRAMRRVAIKSHLRDCLACRQFAAQIGAIGRTCPLAVAAPNDGG